MSTEFKPSAEAQAAVMAFEDMEKVRLLLDKKERAHHLANVRLGVEGSPEDREWYFTETEGIVAKYDEKRDKAGLPA